MMVISKEEGCTTKEAAKMLGLSDFTIRQWLKDGTIAGTKIGSRWYIRRTEVHEIAEKRNSNNASSTSATAMKIPVKEISPTSNIGYAQQEDYDSMLAELGDQEDNVRVNIERVEPKHMAGFLDSYTFPPTLEEIKERYGGGTYRFHIITADGRKVRTTKISGPPISNVEEVDISGRSEHEKPRYRLGSSTTSNRMDSEIGQIIEVVKDATTKSSDQMAEMLQVQTVQSEQRRREDRERWERDQKSREDSHTREMERIRAESEIVISRERERQQVEIQRERERTERDEKRQQEMFQFLATLDQKRETVSKEANTKVEGFFHETIKMQNGIMELKMSMVNQHAESQKEQITEIKESLLKQGVDQGTIGQIIRGLSDAAGQVADKYVNRTPKPQAQPQVPKFNVPTGSPTAAPMGFPMTPPTDILQNAHQVPEVTPGNGANRLNGGIEHHPITSTQDEQAINLLQTHKNETERNQQPKNGDEMSIEDIFKGHPVISQMLEMMALHIHKGLPPTMIGDLLLRHAEADLQVQFALNFAITQDLKVIVALAGPELDNDKRIILLSEQANKFFDGLIGVIVGSFSDEQVPMPNSTETK